MLATEQPTLPRCMVWKGHMESGGFVVRRSEKTLSCVPTDQALVQSINKDAKSKGNVIGYTLKKGSLLRWLLTRHITGDYSERLKEMYASSKRLKLREKLGDARITQDQQDVKRIKDYITDQCQNPFDTEEVSVELVNITTGQIASKEVEESMKLVPEKGKELVVKFLLKTHLNNMSYKHSTKFKL